MHSLPARPRSSLNTALAAQAVVVVAAASAASLTLCRQTDGPEEIALVFQRTITRSAINFETRFLASVSLGLLLGPEAGRVGASGPWRALAGRGRPRPRGASRGGWGAP